MSAAITKDITGPETSKLHEALLAIYNIEHYNGSGYMTIEMDKYMNRLADFGFVKCRSIDSESNPLFLYSLTEKGKRAVENENATKVTKE